MSRFQRAVIALAIILSGMALLPYVALPAEQFSWQRYQVVYEPTPAEQPTNTAVPELAPDPQLNIEPTSGAPGSLFNVTGANFPAGETATISVNGQTLGTLVVGVDGGFAFVLGTANAAAGQYTITVSVSSSVSISFSVDPSAPLNSAQGSGPLFEVPAGLIDEPAQPEQPGAMPPASLPNTGRQSDPLLDALLVLLVVAIGSIGVGLLLRRRTETG